jgi:hypothetical protein
VLGFTRSLAVTAQSHNITVNAVRLRRNGSAASPREGNAASEIAPLVALLVHDSVPCTGEVFAVGAGRCARIAIVAARGYQKSDGPLTIEDVASNWDEVIDIEHAHFMRHSRDESAMYRGRAQWHGSNAGYR